jgi:tRNA(fMet)-specific endonuclease VapC
MSLFALDTDILSLFEAGHPKVRKNVILHPPFELAVTVLTVEERLSGWYTRLRRSTTAAQLSATYDKLADSVEILGQFQILRFTPPAIVRFNNLVAMKLGVRGMDLRIAAVALENAATVVTRNTRDFARVPGLSIEDWSV